jgi:hypothetical protein
MKPQTSPHSAHRVPMRAPRAATMAAASPAASVLLLSAPVLITLVSLGLSLAIILPR